MQDALHFGESLHGASLEALENIAVRQGEDIASKETGLLEKGRFCKVQIVGSISGTGPRLFVRLLGGHNAALEGWISSKTKTGRPLVQIRSAAAALATIQDREDAAPLAPSLTTILQSLDRAEEGSREPDQTKEIDMTDPQARPAFLDVQAPDPDYVAKVNERRLRLMAQEQSRRQARHQRLGKPKWEESARASEQLWAGHEEQIATTVQEKRSAPGPRREAPEARDQGGHDGTSISKANHDFTGVWEDGVGNTYVLVQRGSIVSERKRLGSGESAGCGLAMRNELTMFGSIATLTGDQLRWTDDRPAWTRQLTEVSGEVSSVSASSCEAQPAKGSSSRQPGRATKQLPPDLADLVTAGPDIPSSEWEESNLPRPRSEPLPVAENRLRQVRAEASNQRLWFAAWQDEKL